MDVLNPWTCSVSDFVNRKSCKGIHLFDYASEMKCRDSNGFVSCICAKCGKGFKADCGVNLGEHGRLIPLYQYGIFYG